MMMLLNLVLTALLIFLAFTPNAQANKCLRATTFEELKRDFPVVVRGKVTKRTPLDETSFKIEIEVIETYKGKLASKSLKATEHHYTKTNWRNHDVGVEYTFAIRPAAKLGAQEVILPGDGCPELPKPKDSNETK
ncbi:MAG: hypothetical protein EOP05_02000 [Proteobacteria bacterium]|nr:MAG: hypothetical protein EOP05_02000 [Pseudomonadota bacterium]